jgi:hypothetical protein
MNGEFMELTRSIVKAHIQDADRVHVSAGKSYVPEKGDHRLTWPKLVAAIGTKGAWYSTPRAISGTNKDYVAYLIGDFGVLNCPALQERLESFKG